VPHVSRQCVTKEGDSEMDLNEATGILQNRLEEFKKLSYAELKRLVEDRMLETLEINGASGAEYQLEIEARWDDKPGGSIRMMMAIDDGGVRAFVPLTADFIKAPDESFVGE
jgi:hypothetical protein